MYPNELEAVFEVIPPTNSKAEFLDSFNNITTHVLKTAYALLVKGHQEPKGHSDLLILFIAGLCAFVFSLTCEILRDHFEERKPLKEIYKKVRNTSNAEVIFKRVRKAKISTNMFNKNMLNKFENAEIVVFADMSLPIKSDWIRKFKSPSEITRLTLSEQLSFNNPIKEISNTLIVRLHNITEMSDVFKDERFMEKNILNFVPSLELYPKDDFNTIFSRELAKILANMEQWEKQHQPPSEDCKSKTEKLEDHNLPNNNVKLAKKKGIFLKRKNIREGLHNITEISDVVSDERVMGNILDTVPSVELYSKEDLSPTILEEIPATHSDVEDTSTKQLEKEIPPPSDDCKLKTEKLEEHNLPNNNVKLAKKKGIFLKRKNIREGLHNITEISDVVRDERVMENILDTVPSMELYSKEDLSSTILEEITAILSDVEDTSTKLLEKEIPPPSDDCKLKTEKSEEHNLPNNNVKPAKQKGIFSKRKNITEMSDFVRDERVMENILDTVPSMELYSKEDLSSTILEEIPATHSDVEDTSTKQLEKEIPPPSDDCKLKTEKSEEHNLPNNNVKPAKQKGIFSKRKNITEMSDFVRDERVMENILDTVPSMELYSKEDLSSTILKEIPATYSDVEDTSTKQLEKEIPPPSEDCKLEKSEEHNLPNNNVTPAKKNGICSKRKNITKMSDVDNVPSVELYFNKRFSSSNLEEILTTDSGSDVGETATKQWEKEIPPPKKNGIFAKRKSIQQIKNERSGSSTPRYNKTLTNISNTPKGAPKKSGIFNKSKPRPSA